jgi:DNA-binding beta-propeller fold protein YncE
VITPDGKTAYVNDNGQPSVTPINIATQTAGTPIPGGSCDFITITPDGKTVYSASCAADENGTLSVTPISTATSKGGSPIQVAGWFPVALLIARKRP